jgi:transcriptional antiterminator NusG
MAKAWYVVHTFTGQEKTAKEALEDRVSRFNMQDRIAQVLMPVETVVEVKDGRKRETKRRFFPGYILVEMEMDRETYHFVRETPRITGFVGNARQPPPVPPAEVARITQQVGGEKAGPRPAVNFTRGEEVRVTDGPLSQAVGRIEEVNAARARLRVTVTIFGRPTSVELDFAQVEKVA